jgi:glycosyltransferase involved in cell wall biosynthesis
VLLVQQTGAMRILQLIPDLETGGAERTTLDVAEAVVAEGGEAHVWSTGGRMADELGALGGQLHTADAGTKNPLSVLVANPAALSAIIKQQKIDLVHARSRAPAWSGLIAARHCKVPFVTTYHGIYNGRSGLKRWYNSVMARGDLVIANSQFTANHVIASHALPPDRLRVIPRGVDLARFDRAAIGNERVAVLKAQWLSDSPADWPVILLPGRLTAWKGQRVLIDAAARLRDSGIAATFILAGDSQGRNDYAQSLESQIKALNLSDRVLLAGHCNDMPAALMLSDLVVCPSTDPEAFGRTAAEAQAMAVPVVAAAHGGALEVVVDGLTGELTPPGDAVALADALARLLALSPVKRKSMGQAGKERVEALFSKRALQTATLAVYRELLTGSVS